MHVGLRRYAGLALLACVVAAAGSPAQPPPPALLPPPVPSGPDFVFTPSVELWPFTGPDDPSSGEPPRVEFFPTSLLWEPKLADKRDPRLSAVFHDADSFFSTRTADPSIGLTAGLMRFQPAALPAVSWQIDLFAVAHLRFSRFDESIAQDYRYGLPITFRTGNVVGKIGYEHTSTQLGDELFESGRRARRTFERDEVVGALGYLWRNQLRVYGQSAVAFYQDIPNTTDRWRHDVGFDWYRRESTSPLGQPFAAVNAAFDPTADYRVSMNYQVGWMWRTDGHRLSQFRVYAEFYDGFATFGQLFDRRERYAGFGVSLDY